MKSEKGSFIPFIGLFGAVALGAMVVLAYVMSQLIHASWAQTAADAAALAGAGRGEAAAHNAAAANHGDLLEFVTQGGDTVVRVKSGPITRSARARSTGPTYALDHQE